MAMTLRTNGDSMIADMNTTPLIDVMLVLLTLLIITLPIQTNAVKIDMPTTPTHSTPPPHVDVTVDFDGTVLWDGQAIDRATLDARLASLAQRTPDTEIHLYADRFAKYDTVARVLSDAQRLGVTHIGFGDTAAYQ